MNFLSLSSSFYGPGPLKVDTFVNDIFGLNEVVNDIFGLTEIAY